MKWNFDGKVAIITGAASGIGRQIARDMAASGANVGILDLNAELGEKTSQEINNLNKGKVLFIKTSVTEKDQVDAAVNQIFEKFGDVDFLINCAGILKDFLISRFKEDFWDMTIRSSWIRS